MNANELKFLKVTSDGDNFEYVPLQISNDGADRIISAKIAAGELMMYSTTYQDLFHGLSALRFISKLTIDVSYGDSYISYSQSYKGDTYLIEVIGSAGIARIGGTNGKIVENGDLVICTEDNNGGTEEEVGTYFSIAETNLTNALESYNSIGIDSANLFIVSTGVKNKLKDINVAFIPENDTDPNTFALPLNTEIRIGGTKLSINDVTGVMPNFVSTPPSVAILVLVEDRF